MSTRLEEQADALQHKLDVLCAARDANDSTINWGDIARGAVAAIPVAILVDRTIDFGSKENWKESLAAGVASSVLTAIPIVATTMLRRNERRSVLDSNISETQGRISHVDSLALRESMQELQTTVSR